MDKTEFYMKNIENNRIKKLHYQSWHRGTRENDLILGKFSDGNLESFSSEELDFYENLLAQPDDVLFSWITGQEKPPIAFDHPIVEKIIQFKSKSDNELR